MRDHSCLNAAISKIQGNWVYVMFTCLYNVPRISICRAMFENLHVLNFILNHIPTKPNNEGFCSFTSTVQILYKML